MTTQRYLIVNADDFGISPGVNRGIIEARERGIVTSASLMTRWPGARDAADYARKNPRLSVGLHIDLAEWEFRDGRWAPLYEVVDVTDEAAVRDEVRRQLESFRDLTGRDPDHLDSHQHVHRKEPVLSVARQCASELRVPLRHLSPEIRYRGDFYGQDAEGNSFPQAVGVGALRELISGLGPGVTEMCCHPSRGADLRTMYLLERELELETLCDPRVRDALAAAGVELRSFTNYRDPKT